MPRKIEKNAKSKEEALELAAKEFGVSVDELSYTVEREIGKGILGKLLGREVIISAWVTKDAEEEERLRQTREQRRKILDKKETAPADIDESYKMDYAPASQRAANYAPKQNAASDESRTETANTKADTKTDTNANAKAGNTADAPSAQPARKDSKRRKPTDKSVSDAQYFAENVIHMMGLPDAKVVAENGGDAVNIDVSGERMGLLIGKRGDTLDAVQYLTSLYVNREKNSYIKVNIDTEDYRAKREETLIKLAKSLERKVIRTGSSVALEPMSPNERRIIHAALQDSEDVTTYSIGEEPHRKVVVAPMD